VIESYDVGSLPFVGDLRKFLEGAAAYLEPSPRSHDQARYFERRVVEAFLDKVKVGLDIPNYPQFRDMNKMFLESTDGVEKVKDGYMEAGTLSIPTERAQIPEVAAIKGVAKEIHEKTGRPFRIKVCVTGPYTLASLFVYRDSGTFGRLGEVVSRIVEENLFDGKHGAVGLIAVDEPAFGLVDDPLLDYGAEGRESLRKAWELVFQRAAARGFWTCLHLHSTVDELFWEVESLNVVESHVEDPLYQSERTKRSLESRDKFLKASIGVSDFDRLIRGQVTATLPRKTGATVNERVAETWKSIARGETDPTNFLESVQVMRERLAETVNRFGAERVPYAGPECGLKSFPSYECALECLRRAAKAAKDIDDPR